MRKGKVIAIPASIGEKKESKRYRATESDDARTGKTGGGRRREEMRQRERK